MKRAFGRILAGAAAVLCMVAVACAAGINADEQRVINEVSKPFSYSGKTYMVKSQNIAEGRARLADEDIELTAAEANECIGRFHQSYEELVSEGYCEEQEDSQESPDVQATPERKHSEQEAAMNREYLKKMFGSPKKEKAEKKSSVKEDTVESASPEPTEDIWLQEDTAEADMKFDSQDVKNAVKKQITITFDQKKFQVSGTDEVDGYTKWGVKIWESAFLVLSVLTGLVMVSIIGFIGMMHGRHRRKRKARKIFAVLAGICVTGWFLLILLACGLHFGVYSKSGIHRQVMERDYYVGISQMLQKQMAARLEQNGYDGAIAEEVFHLSNLYIEEKQYIEDVLSGRQDAALSVERIHAMLEEKLRQKDGTADAALIGQIEEDYKNILHFELGKKIRLSREKWQPWFYLTAAVGAALSAFLAILVWMMYGHWHQAVGVHGISLFASSFAVTAATAWAGICRLEERFLVKPVFYYEFIKNYIRWALSVFFYVGCTGLLLAVGMLAIKWHYNRLYK